LQLINVSELKAHPRNDEFFDDITGDNWIEFVKSVKTSGVIEPIVITQDKMIVSGHQRVRACKELGFTQVSCKVALYDNEDKVLKDLLETNLRQRGIGNTNAIKFARCIVELEKIYGIQHGGDKKANPNNLGLKTQTELAENFGISTEQLRNYKKLLTLIPELQDLVEGGYLNATTAYGVWAKLSQADQDKLLNEIGKDKIAELTKKATSDYITEVNKLKLANSELISSNQNITERLLEKPTSVEVQVDNPELQKKIDRLEEDKALLEKKAALNDKEAKEYADLKKSIEQLKKDKSDIGRQIEAATSISGLIVDVEHMLRTTLAPIKYSRAIAEQTSNPTVIKNVIEIIERVSAWCDEMYEILPNDKKYINMDTEELK